MLRWALTFFIIAVIAGVFGFGGIASGAADVGRICFFFFIIAFIFSLFMGVTAPRRRRPLS